MKGKPGDLEYECCSSARYDTSEGLVSIAWLSKEYGRRWRMMMIFSVLRGAGLLLVVAAAMFDIGHFDEAPVRLRFVYIAPFYGILVAYQIARFRFDQVRKQWNGRMKVTQRLYP